MDTVKPAEEMTTPPKKSRPTKVKSVTKSTKKSIKPLPVKLTKQSAENGEAEQTKLEENKDHQRMMVDPMFMIIQSLRSFLTAVTPTAVAPFAVLLPVFT